MLVNVRKMGFVEIDMPNGKPLGVFRDDGVWHGLHRYVREDGGYVILKDVPSAFSEVTSNVVDTNIANLSSASDDPFVCDRMVFGPASHPHTFVGGVSAEKMDEASKERFVNALESVAGIRKPTTTGEKAWNLTK